MMGREAADVFEDITNRITNGVNSTNEKGITVFQYLDCIHIKVRDSGTVGTKSVYLALGVTMSGVKELLGIWISPNEGAKF